MAFHLIESVVKDELKLVKDKKKLNKLRIIISSNPCFHWPISLQSDSEPP